MISFFFPPEEARKRRSAYSCSMFLATVSGSRLVARWKNKNAAENFGGVSSQKGVLLY
jgi:hypothetical protein